MKTDKLDFSFKVIEVSDGPIIRVANIIDNIMLIRIRINNNSRIRYEKYND